VLVVPFQTIFVFQDPTELRVAVSRCR
jgi:hypothetical protein